MERGMSVVRVRRSKGQERELARKRRARRKRERALSGPVLVSFVDPLTLRETPKL